MTAEGGDDLLFHLVNAAAFFPAVFFQNEPWVSRNLAAYRARFLVMLAKILAHQLRDYLMRFSPSSVANC